MLRRDLLWALNPVMFAREALDFHPDPSQARVLLSTNPRLLLNCTRQWGKSTSAAALALHRALYSANSLILLVSPSQRQSSELFRKVAAFLNQLAIKPAKLEDNQFSLQLANGSRIVALPGKEATVRGFSGVTLIIEDEASRVEDQLYRAIRPMLAVSGGRLILMSTPYGKRGHFFEEWTNGGSFWERIEW
jgi:phage terminase large subunit-like protein